MFSPEQESTEISFGDELRLRALDNELRAGDPMYYLEPVEVDTYIKEESRFDVTIEILKIKLPEVQPLSDDRGEVKGLSRNVFDEAREKDQPIQIRDILENERELIAPVEKIYKQYFPLIDQFRDRITRFREGDSDALLVATYITETLLKFEPSYISLRYFGDFHTYNLNWLISKLNINRVLIDLEIDTVEYLINRCDQYAPEHARDEKYQSLSALFLHKARYEY